MNIFFTLICSRQKYTPFSFLLVHSFVHLILYTMVTRLRETNKKPQMKGSKDYEVRKGYDDQDPQERRRTALRTGSDDQ